MLQRVGWVLRPCAGRRMAHPSLFTSLFLGRIHFHRVFQKNCFMSLESKRDKNMTKIFNRNMSVHHNVAFDCGVEPNVDAQSATTGLGMIIKGSWFCCLRQNALSLCIFIFWIAPCAILRETNVWNEFPHGSIETMFMQKQYFVALSNIWVTDLSRSGVLIFSHTWITLNK